MNGPPNNIGWTDATWNPVTGCKHGCRFGPRQAKCYAEVIAERLRGSKAFPHGFDPEFHPHRLREPRVVKTPLRIFVCSMADLFGAWIPPDWIGQVLETVRACPQHTFQMLTKAPWVAEKYAMPENVWLGATVTGGLANEKVRLDCVRRYQARVRFLSCEPLEGPVDVARAEPHWIIIGAATGPGGYQPEEAWVRGIEDYADAHGIPVYHKDNLRIRRHARRQEWPDGHTASARPPAPRGLPLDAGRR